MRVRSGLIGQALAPRLRCVNGPADRPIRAMWYEIGSKAGAQTRRALGRRRAGLLACALALGFALLAPAVTQAKPSVLLFHGGGFVWGIPRSPTPKRWRERTD